MSEKRKIEDKDLKNVTGGEKPPPIDPGERPQRNVVGGTDDPDTNAQPGDNQNFTD